MQNRPDDSEIGGNGSSPQIGHYNDTNEVGEDVIDGVETGLFHQDNLVFNAMGSVATSIHAS